MDKVITYGITFIFGVGAGWILQGKYWDIFYTSYVPALATLVAAFYGAKYAFQFQNNKEKKDNYRRNVINGNIAIFNISSMVMKLTEIKIKIIDLVRNHRLVCIEMKPTIQLSNNININIDTLYFLLETDDRNLLGELSLEVDRYLAVLDAINERSLFHREQIQPVLDAKGIKDSPTISLSYIESALGDYRFSAINKATSDIIELVDKTIISLESILEKFTVCLKKQYPNEIILKPLKT